MCYLHYIYIFFKLNDYTPYICTKKNIVLMRCNLDWVLILVQFKFNAAPKILFLVKLSL